MLCKISILIFIFLRRDPAPAQPFLNLEAAAQKLQCQAGHSGSPYHACDAKDPGKEWRRGAGRKYFSKWFHISDWGAINGPALPAPRLGSFTKHPFFHNSILKSVSCFRWPCLGTRNYPLMPTLFLYVLPHYCPFTLHFAPTPFNTGKGRHHVCSEHAYGVAQIYKTGISVWHSRDLV